MEQDQWSDLLVQLLFRPQRPLLDACPLISARSALSLRPRHVPLPFRDNDACGKRTESPLSLQGFSAFLARLGTHGLPVWTPQRRKGCYEEVSAGEPPTLIENDGLTENETEVESVDTLSVYKEKALQAFQENRALLEQIQRDGKSWGTIGGFLKEALPDTLEDRHDIAFNLVREALERNFGPVNEAWHTVKRQTGEKLMTWVIIGKPT
jgi:hypothetical protein